MELESELLLDSKVEIVELSLAIPELSETMLEERFERLERPAEVPELIEELIDPFADSMEL